MHVACKRLTFNPKTQIENKQKKMKTKAWIEYKWTDGKCYPGKHALKESREETKVDFRSRILQETKEDISQQEKCEFIKRLNSKFTHSERSAPQKTGKRPQSEGAASAPACGGLDYGQKERRDGKGNLQGS